MYNKSRGEFPNKKKTKSEDQFTDPFEMMVVIGTYLVMSYNRVPQMRMYWSQNASLRNLAIQNAIGRDRFLMLSAKLYFNNPEKPQGSSKTYVLCRRNCFLLQIHLQKMSL